jgi:hypothetical protein
MIASITIPDPTAALMLAALDVDGRARSRRRDDLRRQQRRHQRHARLRRLFA